MTIAIIGCGYDGSYLPADTVMLAKSVPDHDSPARLIEATVAINDQSKFAMTFKVDAATGGDLNSIDKSGDETGQGYTYANIELRLSG